MNWTRGLLRLWLVASLIWLAVVAIMSYQFAKQHGGYIEMDFYIWSIVWAVPAAVAFILGWLILWVAKGFKGAKS